MGGGIAIFDAYYDLKYQSAFWLAIIMFAVITLFAYANKDKFQEKHNEKLTFTPIFVQAVAKAISQVSGKDATVIVITHYARILKFLDNFFYYHVYDFLHKKICKKAVFKIFGRATKNQKAPIKL